MLQDVSKPVLCLYFSKTKIRECCKIVQGAPGVLILILKQGKRFLFRFGQILTFGNLMWLSTFYCKKTQPCIAFHNKLSHASINTSVESGNNFVRLPKLLMKNKRFENTYNSVPNCFSQAGFSHSHFLFPKKNSVPKHGHVPFAVPKVKLDGNPL